MCRWVCGEVAQVGGWCVGGYVGRWNGDVNRWICGEIVMCVGGGVGVVL